MTDAPALYSIIIFKHVGNSDPIVLSANYDVSSFNFFQRGKVKEFCLFASRTAAARSTLNVRAVVQQGDYQCYFYRIKTGITAVLTGTASYPRRVAFDLVVRCADVFEKRVGGESVQVTKDCMDSDAELMDLLMRFQKPEEADKILKIHKDIAEVREIMYDNIEKLLQRGEKIEDLVARSTDLTLSSKQFATTSKKLNRRCMCTIM